MRANTQAPLPFFRRLVAGGMAACVLALSLLAFAPEAHGHLHCDAGHEDHECAITFFAQGVTLATAIAAPPAARVVWFENFPAAPEQLPLVAAKYLLPPQCGPPLRARS